MKFIYLFGPSSEFASQNLFANMAFFLDVGTDLFGSKQNTRLEFAGCPTLSELIIASEAHFDREGRLRRPAGSPDVSYKIQTMQVYDDTLLRWVDLYSPTQLRNGGQVWCFQPESIYHSEAPGSIPPAKYTPESWLGSPARARAVSEAGIRDPVASEKLRSVFYNIDTSNNVCDFFFLMKLSLLSFYNQLKTTQTEIRSLQHTP